MRGKKYTENKAKIDRNRLYPAAEAIKLAKEASYAKFDATLEMHMTVKKQGFSVQVALPHFAGKAKKVEVATDKTVVKLKEGKVDFDVLLATADMMPKLVPFAKLLGPKGLMPNPKNGTLIKDADLSAHAEKFSASTMTVKTEKSAPVVHTVVGKVSQKDAELQKNIEVVMEAMGKNQILKAYLVASMGPSVKVAVN